MSTESIIRTRGLSMRYGGNYALKNVNLEIATGEIFGLLGHNGAGKTTTVSIITTLLKPSLGSAEVCGLDTLRDSRDVRRQIGYLPENVELYESLTLKENLLYFARLSGVAEPDRRIEDVLQFLDFTTCMDKKLSTFSKGMRQRAGIAQAILHRPRVLFLDEPASGLDPQGVIALRQNIQSLNREMGMTIFMNTHSLSEVTKTCTNIGILRQGELLYQDSLSQTMAAFPEQASLEDIYLRIDADGR